MSEQLGDEYVRHSAGMLGVTKQRLGRKGMVFEPGQQPISRRSDDIELRKVHMGIDEPRRNEPAPMIVFDLLAWSRRSNRAYRARLLIDFDHLIGFNVRIMRTTKTQQVATPSGHAGEKVWIHFLELSVYGIAGRIK